MYQPLNFRRPSFHWNLSFHQRQSIAFLALTGAALTLAGCGGSSNSGGSTPANGVDTVGSLAHITQVASTVDAANADNNPYALAIAPTTFTGDGNPAHVQPGDIVVGNFGATGQGTTFEALRGGAPVRVYSEASAPTAAGSTVTTAGPVALAFAPNGNLWIANYGASGNGSDGNVQIVKPAGIVASTFTDPKVIGGWGQVYNGGFGGKSAFFTVNITNGTVARINILAPAVAGGPPTFTFDQITPDLGHAPTSPGGTPVGPLGLVHTNDDTLYIADGATNSIIAIPNSTTITAQSTGTVIYQNNALNQPAGMTLNPVNGDLIIANQKDNNLVEITTAGRLVGTKTVDPAVVNPATGANSGLFGVTAAKDAAGHLNVYFTDDNTNTVGLLAP